MSELNADLLVVDDDDARKYAIEQKIPIIGTAGILVLAKQNGFITEVRQLLEQLLARGFYMSRATSRRSSSSRRGKLTSEANHKTMPAQEIVFPVSEKRNPVEEIAFPDQET